MERAIQWFSDRKGKVTYSMSSRNGPSSFDCSSAVYYSLVQAGYFPAGIWIGNTDSLYGDLEKRGWVSLPRDSNGNIAAQRGDIFIWGKRGASGGAYGHTGVFVDADNIIHCNYGYNGITVNNHDYIWAINGGPDYAIYRYVGTPAPSTGINRGDTVKFPGGFVVDRRDTVNDITQVSAQTLYKTNFDWTDNGISVAGIAKVDAEGYRLTGTTAVGESFVIPGKFTVHDVMQDSGENYALVTVGGYEVWVAVSALEEIGANESGKAVPVVRPVDPLKPTIPDPVVPPVIQVPEVVPETPVTDTPVVDEPVKEEPVKPNKPKEVKMAFSKEDMEKLRIQNERVQEQSGAIAAGQGVQEITGSISKKTKVTVYIIGDTLIGLGLLIPNLAVVFATGDANQIVALSSLFATAGAFLLTMFGIYKKKDN